MKIGRYIVGLLSGLTFGMLFAPKKGSQLRAELMKKGGESGQEALFALFKAFRDAGADAAGELRKLTENEQLRSALNMSKERMHEYLSQLEEGGYDVAAHAQEKVEAIAQMATAFGSQFKNRALRREGAVVRGVKNRVKQVKKTVLKRNAVKKNSSRKK